MLPKKLPLRIVPKLFKLCGVFEVKDETSPYSVIETFTYS